MSLNIAENLFLKRATNLLNLTSSRRISDERPRLNPPSPSILEGGTFNERNSFFLKYSISVISPRFCPPGRVEISVPLPPSLRGNQKSSSIAMNFLSSRTSPVDESYTCLLRYRIITSRRYCSALTFGRLPTSM